VNVFDWFSTPGRWSGNQGIPNRLLEHLEYAGWPLLIALVVAVPVGALIGHTGRGGFLVVGIANGLRAVPELGLLILLVLLMGVNVLPVTIALVVLAIPPILAGTYSGVRNVDRSVVDAARGVGMRGGKVLWSVELPNALPLIFGGLRAASLQVIATATIAAFVGLGGLGRYVFDGLRQRDFPAMLGGAILIALLAVLTEIVLLAIQGLVVSRGLHRNPTRRRDRRARPVDLAVTRQSPAEAPIPSAETA
jgi:osmoprotectant transport system permease protein